MKRASREISAFNLSALDLFASALGAFILLTVIFLPFFPNTGDSPEIIEALRKQIGQVQADLAKAEKQAAEDRAAAQAAQDVAAAAQQAQQQAQSALQEAQKRTTLLGIETDAQRIAIIIDMSGSLVMNNADGDALTILAVTEIVSTLQDDVELHFIGFQSTQGNPLTPIIHDFPQGQGYLPIGGNSQKFLSTLNSWMGRVSGGTPTFSALQRGLDLDPEAIILISDGAPSPEFKDPQDIIEEITRQNNGKVKIHAVAIGNYHDQRDFIEFLSGITRNNDGDLTTTIGRP